jgi:hypothetical protein
VKSNPGFFGRTSAFNITTSIPQDVGTDPAANAADQRATGAAMEEGLPANGIS